MAQWQRRPDRYQSPWNDLDSRMADARERESADRSRYMRNLLMNLSSESMRRTLVPPVTHSIRCSFLVRGGTRTLPSHGCFGPFSGSGSLKDTAGAADIASAAATISARATIDARSAERPSAGLAGFSNKVVTIEIKVCVTFNFPAATICAPPKVDARNAERRSAGLGGSNNEQSDRGSA